jgi:hypothetical protein
LALKYNNKPKTPGHLIPHRRRKQSSTKKCKTIGLLCLLVHTHTHTHKTVLLLSIEFDLWPLFFLSNLILRKKNKCFELVH